MPRTGVCSTPRETKLALTTSDRDIPEPGVLAASPFSSFIQARSLPPPPSRVHVHWSAISSILAYPYHGRQLPTPFLLSTQSRPVYPCPRSLALCPSSPSVRPSVRPSTFITDYPLSSSLSTLFISLHCINTIYLQSLLLSLLHGQTMLSLCLLVSSLYLLTLPPSFPSSLSLPHSLPSPFFSLHCIITAARRTKQCQGPRCGGLALSVRPTLLFPSFWTSLVFFSPSPLQVRVYRAEKRSKRRSTAKRQESVPTCVCRVSSPQEGTASINGQGFQERRCWGWAGLEKLDQELGQELDQKAGMMRRPNRDAWRKWGRRLGVSLKEEV